MEYYRILGVEKNASALDIKSAYRKMARLYHPDFNPGKNTEVIFIHIKKAYDTLCDPVKRKTYDDGLHGYDPPGESGYERAAEDYYPNRDEVIFERRKPPVENVEERKTRLIVFTLAGEEYAFRIGDVLGIADCSSMAPPARASVLIQGRVCMHDEELPVVDLARNFGLAGTEGFDKKSIVTVEADGVKVGLLVDTVPRVVELPGEMIFELPQILPGESPLTMELGRVDDQIIIILNPRRVLSPLTMAVLRGMA